ncbi:MAG: hypothetical protein WC763_01055 [Candidatus Paceibacterota bacterium]
MKKFAIALVAVIVVSGVSLVLLERGAVGTDSSVPDLSAEVSNMVVRGTVTDVNVEKAMYDGPYLVTIRETNGNEAIVSIPSRGAQLCAAKATTASPSDLKKGMTVEVNGALTFDGNIVPCESVSHYLRIVTKQ